MCWWGRIVRGGDAQCEEVWHDEVVQKGGGEVAQRWEKKDTVISMKYYAHKTSPQQVCV